MTDDVRPNEPTATGPTATGPTATLRTSDPAVLRALAHPLRVEILAIIDEVGEATASEVAERTGQTVANCSFHLRSLAKAGFIERAPDRGREKPWRSAHRQRDLRPDPDDAASVRESGVISAAYIQHEAGRLTRFFTGDPRDMPPEWVPAVTVNSATFWATADEMRQFSEEVNHLVDRFAGRTQDPSLRPAGAVRGRFFATVNPELD
jgi:DNA-binding transcriptional ArsR family regulator